MTHKIAGKVKRAVFDHKQVWQHNGLMGQCKRAITAMQSIYDAETTTDECRKLAGKIEGELAVLFRELHTRRDQCR